MRQRRRRYGERGKEKKVGGCVGEGEVRKRRWGVVWVRER
jgi:hypothetical protein